MREPWELNAGECADWLDMDIATFRRRKLDPLRVSGREKLFDIREVLKAERLREHGADVEDIDTSGERLLRLHAERKLIEVQNAVETGDLILIEDALKPLIEAMSNFATMIEVIPATIRRNYPEISGSTLFEIETVLGRLQNTTLDKGDECSELFMKEMEK